MRNNNLLAELIGWILNPYGYEKDRVDRSWSGIGFAVLFLVVAFVCYKLGIF